MYARILVPVDGSATAESALREGLALAAQIKAEVILLHVLDDETVSIERAPARYALEVLEARRGVAEKLVGGYVRLAQESGTSARGIVRDGLGSSVADIIVEEAKAQACDLIVMGTHGRRGFNRLALGSDAESVARRSSAPVLLVRHAQALP